MKSALVCFTAIVFALLLSSCSDDPVSSHGGGGGGTTQSFQPTLVSLDGDFTSVCGTGKDMYAIGSAMLHYDGAQWSAIEPPPLHGNPYYALGFPDGEIVVSDGGDTYVRKNGAWSDISSTDYFYMNALWGSSPTDLYGVGYQGVRHYDGSTWNAVTLPIEDDLYAVTGRSANDVVISGYRGNLLRYDGTQWTNTQIDSFVTYRSLAMTPSGRVFGCDFQDVYEVTGSTHHVILHQDVEQPVLCTADEVLYVTGRDRYEYGHFVIARYQDNAWKNVVSEQGEVEGLWAGSGNIVVAGRDNVVWRGTDSGGTFEHPIPLRGEFSCAAEIDGAVFVAGQGAYRYEHETWTNLNKEYMTRNYPADIAGRNRNDIYAVGNEMILHYDGSDWSWVNAGFNQQLSSVCIDPNGDVLVAGSTQGYPGSTVAYRLHNGSWAPEEIPFDGRPIFDLCTTGNVMFAVGGHGMVAVHRNGAWRPLPSGTTETLVSVWAFDEQNVFAANGERNELCYYDGRYWTPLQVDGAGNGIWSIWGTRNDDLFAVGWRGTVTHYDGRFWKPLPNLLTYGVGEVCGAGRDILAISREGVISYHR